MLKEIIKVKFIPSIDSTLDLGILDPCFDDVLLKGDYHINFAGHDQSIVFENIETQSLFKKSPDARHASSEDTELTDTSMSSPRSEHNNADGAFRIGSKQIKDLQDLSLAMKTTIQDYEIEGIQSLIFTFIGNATDYVRSPIDYEFCVEL